MPDSPNSEETLPVTSSMPTDIPEQQATLFREILLLLEEKRVPYAVSVASKIFVAMRKRFDGTDTAHTIYATYPKFDWQRELKLVGEHWEMLLWSLLLFRYVYPAQTQYVPAPAVESEFNCPPLRAWIAACSCSMRGRDIRLLPLVIRGHEGIVPVILTASTQALIQATRVCFATGMG